MNYKDIPKVDFLAHHGIKGQKWGVRRFQNSDGSLTPEGEKRYGTKEERMRAREKSKEDRARSKELKSSLKSAKKTYKQQKLKEKLLEENNIAKIYKNRKLFTDDELSQAIKRASLYNQMKSMNKSSVDKAVNFINKSTNVVNAGLNAFSAYNRVAGITNALSGKNTLPNFDPEVRKAASALLKEKKLREVPYDEVLKNLDKYSTKDLEAISKRSAYVKVLERNK